MKGVAKTERREGAIEVVETDRPEPEDDEVIVEPAYAGLCGSDAGIYEFEEAFERMDLPNVIGHEYAGRVVEVGANVTEFEVGDLVVERVIRFCGECYQCRTGRQNVCQRAQITGVDHDGAFAEAIAVPARALHHLPEGMDLARAALTEPTAVALRAAATNAQVSPGDRVLVEGPGPIGLLSAQIADIEGAEVVVSGVGRDADHRLPLAEELGYRAVNVVEEDVEAVAEEVTDGVGFDVVVDSTGHESGLITGGQVVTNGGRVVVVGQSGRVDFDLTPFIRREIDIQCSYTYDYEDFERSIRLLDEGRIDDAFVDTRFSLHDVDEAFEAFFAGEVCKPLFDVSELRQ